MYLLAKMYTHTVYEVMMMTYIIKNSCVMEQTKHEDE